MEAIECTPFVKVSRVKTEKGKVIVVRDDLLQGGTKQRAAVPFLRSFLRTGVHEFVYASPFSGFAQVALAFSCRHVGASCTLFAERFCGGISEITSAVAHLSDVRLADTLGEAEKEAVSYVQGKSHCLKIPLGFNHPLFKEFLRSELTIQWEHLCDKLGYIPKRLWLPVGSGTLADTFSKIVSEETSLSFVDVRVLPNMDDRIKKIKGILNSEYSEAVEPFHAPALTSPPIPSNKYYDAKLWQFVYKNAGDNEVWWNVAG